MRRQAASRSDPLPSSPLDALLDSPLRTRFLVLGPKASEPTGRDHTSLLAMAQDGPGALLHLLEPLARRGLNLSRIQSRPTRRRVWEYAFFLDVEGHADELALAQALEDLKRVCASLKVLGSYPRAGES